MSTFQVRRFYVQADGRCRQGLQSAQFGAVLNRAQGTAAG
jgi:hypothetical protein